MREQRNGKGRVPGRESIFQSSMSLLGIIEPFFSPNMSGSLQMWQAIQGNMEWKELIELMLIFLQTAGSMSQTIMMCTFLTPDTGEDACYYLYIIFHFFQCVWELFLCVEELSKWIWIRDEQLLDYHMLYPVVRWQMDGFLLFPFSSILWVMQTNCLEWNTCFGIQQADSWDTSS